MVAILCPSRWSVYISVLARPEWFLRTKYSVTIGVKDRVITIRYKVEISVSAVVPYHLFHRLQKPVNISVRHHTALCSPVHVPCRGHNRAGMIYQGRIEKKITKKADHTFLEGSVKVPIFNVAKK